MLGRTQIFIKTNSFRPTAYMKDLSERRIFLMLLKNIFSVMVYQKSVSKFSSIEPSVAEMSVKGEWMI